METDKVYFCILNVSILLNFGSSFLFLFLDPTVVSCFILCLLGLNICLRITFITFNLMEKKAYFDILNVSIFLSCISSPFCLYFNPFDVLNFLSYLLALSFLSSSLFLYVKKYHFNLN